MRTMTDQFQASSPLGEAGKPLADAIAAAAAAPGPESFVTSALDLLNSYAMIFVAAFLVTLLTTPLIRKLAINGGIVDLPDSARKLHAQPTPYLGGVAVFLGLIVALGLSYVVTDGVAHFAPVSILIVVGMVAITVTGLADDIWGWDPRLKIAGQLVAAAALAYGDIGTRVAEGLLSPILGPPATPLLAMGGLELLNAHVFYWVGTAIIAIFVLGGCNSANLLDGMDGLLSGVVAIVALGLLVISLLMATQAAPDPITGQEATLTGARVVLSFALLGAVLGFLPHNFNPATIFLGDCGSLLLGYVSVVIILTFGEMGQTHLVLAGLIVYSLPIMDTTLAIIRRRLAGASLSAADDQHIHHQLKRSLGGVKKAVFTLYGIAFAFGILGVTLAALVMLTELRVRIVYAIALVLFSFVGVVAVKAARRQQWKAMEDAAAIAAARRGVALSARPSGESAPRPRDGAPLEPGVAAAKGSVPTR